MPSTSQIARAVRLAHYGPPDVLTYEQVQLEPLAAHEIRIKTIAAAINHTDLKIRAGIWPIAKARPFPYVPGVEVVGAIVAVGESVRDYVSGQVVITMMQGMGGVRAERSGGYADFVTVSADAVAIVPPDLNPQQVAALGLGAVTAVEGLRKLGPLQGKRILVTGAAGGVGAAAVAIAKAQGADVVASISRADRTDYVRSMGAGEVVITPKGAAPSLQRSSLDGVLDTVGGNLFPTCVAALREGGALCLVGAVAGGDVSFDAWQLIRPVTLTGYSTESLNGTALRDAFDSISNWLRSGSLAVPTYRCLPLAQASHAHRLLEQGGVIGRVLLTP